MKVLMAVISDMAHDARVYKEARTLSDAGAEVTVVSTTPGRSRLEYDQDGIRIIALPLDVAGRSGVAAFYRQMVQEMSTRPADVIHAHNVHTLPFCWWAARWKGARLVYDSHELFTGLQLAEPSFRERVKQLLERTTERFFIRAAHGVITVSHSYADIIARTYRIARPAIVQNTSPLVPLRRRCGVVRDRLGLSADRLVVIYQGGYHLVTRALDKLVLSARHLPDRYAIVLIGFAVRGEERLLMELAEREGLSDRVFFLPPVPHQELPDYTMDADIGVIPFIDNCPAMHYCTPNKIYEYLMAGIPVVSTDLPELRRVVDRWKVGALCDPTRPDELAAAIRQVGDDPDSLSAAKSRARDAAEQEYNWSTEGGALMDLYRRITPGGWPA